MLGIRYKKITDLPRRIVNHLRWLLLLYFYRYFSYVYHLYIFIRIKQIRRKEKIKVLFVVAELASWKTENLYVAMSNNNRFECIIGICQSREVPGSKNILLSYVKEKGYNYIDLDRSDVTVGKIKADLAFYYKPYDGSYPQGIYFKDNLRTIPCHIDYAFTTMRNPKIVYHEICRYSLFVYAENILVRDALYHMYGKRNISVRVTGVPMQDRLCRSKEDYSDTWKNSDERKRIIYAPHHSMKGFNGNGVEYATFLEYGEFMLDLARKYSDKVYFAFKPHPTLYPKLLKVWGKDKTDNYYKQWQAMENSQYSPGEYMGLFMYSDAMIHDCGSFQVEYLYTKNPVLYLVSEGHNTEDQNEFGRMAFDMHYKAYSTADIENFILNVINGVDERKEERLSFYNNYLLPPNGKTACDNIIDTILNKH